MCVTLCNCDGAVGALTALCRPLQVVVLHSFNTLEFPLIFLALNRLGAVCSTSSPLFNAEELASQIEISEVRERCLVWV